MTSVSFYTHTDTHWLCYCKVQHQISNINGQLENEWNTEMLEIICSGSMKYQSVHDSFQRIINNCRFLSLSDVYCIMFFHFSLILNVFNLFCVVFELSLCRHSRGSEPGTSCQLFVFFHVFHFWQIMMMTMTFHIWWTNEACLVGALWTK